MRGASPRPPIMKYEFNKAKHLHLLDGKALTGCTTVLSVVAKPALIQWAANMAVDYIKEHRAVLNVKIDGVEYPILTTETLLEEARKAHCKRKKEAGDYGTRTHEEVELIVNRAIKESEGLITGHTVGESKPISNFVEWAIQNKVKFLESEKNIYSEQLWIGGIVDLVVEIDGQVWIGDVKTSGSGIYPENFWQCAGYQLMLNNMNLYPNIAGYLILNLKESGEFIEKRSISNEENKEAFLACLKIYRIQEKLKNQII